jgi:hypothetical protein
MFFFRISFFEGSGVERPSDLRRDGSVGLAAVEVAHRCNGVALQVRKPENTFVFLRKGLPNRSEMKQKPRMCISF